MTNPRQTAAAKAKRAQLLAYANLCRQSRSRVKHGVRREQVTIGEAMALTTMDRVTVFALLCLRKRIGPAKARRLLAEHRLSETVTVGQLSPRTRHRLARDADQPPHKWIGWR